MKDVKYKMGKAINPISKVFGRIETGVNDVVDTMLGASVDLSEKKNLIKWQNHMQAQISGFNNAGNADKAKELQAKMHEVDERIKKPGEDTTIELSGQDYLGFRTAKAERVKMPKDKPADPTSFYDEENASKISKSMLTGGAAIIGGGITGLTLLNHLGSSNN